MQAACSHLLSERRRRSRDWGIVTGWQAQRRRRRSGKAAQADLEQTLAFTGGEVVYLDGRETMMILV